MRRPIIASVVCLTVYLGYSGIAAASGVSGRNTNLRATEVLIILSASGPDLVGQFATNGAIHPLMSPFQSSDDKKEEGQNTGDKREDPQPPQPPPPQPPQV